ncbi:NADP oxidoreductase (plasmid) [Deinococcus aetherius]|uniref:NADP oxidoreductase n=1 Tax=Deinococcus aetherius TaxID=200252 RepID=A0ABM8AJ27_9DEIO|nr:NAD(P)-binding domain-containing protein [Deinococcus aetherius]BDP43815.1 NADP oxidoreductase [Deinococcus aetherius]
MNIGIIGSGHIGGTLARLFSARGHAVLLANSRGPESLREMVAELGPGVRAVTPQEAAREAEVVVEAIPFGRLTELPREDLSGKILVTAANYYPERDGEIDLGGLSEAEYTARLLPGVRVVKAFNTIWFRHLAEQGDPGKPQSERRAIFVEADDPGAKAVVSHLIDELGFAPVDGGDLPGSTRFQPGSPLYNRDLTGREAREALATS